MVTRARAPRQVILQAVEGSEALCSAVLQGARSHCRFAPPTSTHPVHTIFTNIIGTPISEATMFSENKGPSVFREGD
jgi:hypothetical protein